MGAFGVDMELFNRCVDVEAASCVGSDLVMIDEIGIIGDWSKRFQDYVTRALDSTIPVVAIIRFKTGEFSDEVKLRNDLETWTVTENSRDSLAGDIASWVNGAKAFDANKA
jgi:nucleoside-triphosphatase THEP1